ncbi:hypothetical protein A2U01_0061081, partial [Trifolium medium]|nr:hypothetical protein [Trifolium medium]
DDNSLNDGDGIGLYKGDDVDLCDGNNNELALQ